MTEMTKKKEMTLTAKMVTVGLVAALVGGIIGFLIEWKGIRSGFPPGAQPTEIIRSGTQVIVKVQVKRAPTGHTVQLKSTDKHEVVLSLIDGGNAERFEIPEAHRKELEKLVTASTSGDGDYNLPFDVPQTHPIKVGSKVDATVVLWATISGGKKSHQLLVGSNEYDKPILVKAPPP